jgi:hypothetical protein
MLKGCLFIDVERRDGKIRKLTMNIVPQNLSQVLFPAKRELLRLFLLLCQQTGFQCCHTV